MQDVPVDIPVEKIWVKICGIRRPADLVVAAEEGADAVGLVFDSSSPRAVSTKDARLLVSIGGADVLCVGVFRNVPAASVTVTVDEVGLEAIQYYGDPGEFAAIRRSLPHLKLASFAVNVSNHRADRLAQEVVASFESPEELPDVLVFDAATPGSGRTWKWESLSEYFGPIPFVLAGGLNSQNVGDAICAVRPWGVDVSSSLEVRPGVKDPDLVHKFMAAVRQATMIRDTIGARAQRLYGHT